MKHLDALHTKDDSGEWQPAKHSELKEGMDVLYVSPINEEILLLVVNVEEGEDNVVVTFTEFPEDTGPYFIPEVPS